MKKMADIIMCMAETMKGMSHSSYLSVKELLSCSSWKYMHECPDRKHTQEPPRIVMQGEDDYKEHFQIAGEFSSKATWVGVATCSKREREINTE